MESREFGIRHIEAVNEFNQHGGRDDGERVISSLNAGLNNLRELFYLRLHRDVERMIGKDSMLIPVSELKTQKLMKTEIELYQIAESKAAIKSFGCLGADDAWYLPWLTRLRLRESSLDANVLRRLDDYLAKTPHHRQLAFTDVLVKNLPESNRAPLVLFQLFPLSVQIATVLAFGNNPATATLRAQQEQCLPAICDCHLCHGRLLTNGEQCGKCGNPLWKPEWLAAD